jgi:hypothetical protein
MIFLYTLVLIALGAIKFLIDRRAGLLAWRYSRLARTVDQLVREPVFKDGNSSRFNPCQAARRQYLLGYMVQKKERLEAKHYAWQNRSDKLARALNRLRGWKGKKLPYTLGAVDVWLFLYLVDYLDVDGCIRVRQTLEALGAMLGE